jgi:flagellar biosynthesis GTPase FlhF
MRTEFLKYIRKINIDLSYNKNSNKIYTNSIISIEDNLVLLKTNPLITNFRYPTRLLSYFKDFVNLSARTEYHQQMGKSFSESDPSSDINTNLYSLYINSKPINNQPKKYKPMSINMQVNEEKSEAENENEEEKEKENEKENEKEMEKEDKKEPNEEKKEGKSEEESESNEEEEKENGEMEKEKNKVKQKEKEKEKEKKGKNMLKKFMKKWKKKVKNKW